MSDTLLDSFPIGAGKFLPVDHTGPASYTSGGETLGTLNNLTGIALLGLDSIDMVLGSGNLALSGNYTVTAQQSGAGVRKTWLLRWFYAPVASGISGASFTAGSGYPNGTYVLTANSGSATITVVISGGAITSAYVSNPGSGYATKPTFTLTPFEGVVVVQNAAGISMTAASGMQAPMTFAGGNGNGAAGYITVTGATTCTITVTNPGTGYTSAPTATVSNAVTGGTAPTLTVSVGSTAAVAATGLGPISDLEVSAGTSLTGETVRLAYVGK